VQVHQWNKRVSEIQQKKTARKVYLNCVTHHSCIHCISPVSSRVDESSQAYCCPVSLRRFIYLMRFTYLLSGPRYAAPLMNKPACKTRLLARGIAEEFFGDNVSFQAMLAIRFCRACLQYASVGILSVYM